MGRDRLPTIEEIVEDINRVLEENDGILVEELTIDRYRRLGGKYDGRKLRKLGGFANILKEQFGVGDEDAGDYRLIRETLPDAKRYLITAAQNATPIHEDFLEALKVAAEYLDAELVAVPIRYRNPTSQWTQPQDSHDWWAKEVKPYLFKGRKHLNRNLVLAADIKTQPTASSPLSGFESLTRAESCVIGHTKMQLRTVPVPSGRYPKILSTTGACTVPNFTDTKTGKIGAFHHFLGAVVVEIDGDTFHLRQINASNEDGSFIDLDKEYTKDGVRDAPPALGLVMGDVHAKFIDPNVEKATFGPEGMINLLNPKTLVYHDVIDNYAVNPHSRVNPFIAQAKVVGAMGSVRAEVEHSVQFVKDRGADRQSVIVFSNHDDFLNRWIINNDWRTDPVNAAFYLETALAITNSVVWTPEGGKYLHAYSYWVNKLKKNSNIRCLDEDESFMLADNECGLHGNQGPNGAKGTLKNLSRLGTKVISAHTHVPGIDEGNYQVGTSTYLRLGYNHGPSSWMNTHCIVYANGKRALINIIKGKWHLRN